MATATDMETVEQRMTSAEGRGVVDDRPARAGRSAGDFDGTDKVGATAQRLGGAVNEFLDKVGG